ncbi:hypothetical protein HK101_007592 [Irineochytrium annulatum]|nr:hypothetical protein HK101_007592 [Irineochytrium annulatum]
MKGRTLIPKPSRFSKGFAKEFEVKMESMATEEVPVGFKGSIMWQSKTADLWYAIPPYTASFSDFGGFQVRDAALHVLWETAAGGDSTSALQVGDDGALSIINSDGSLVWNLRGDENSSAIWTVSKQPYRQCNACDACTIATVPGPLVNLATRKCLSWSNGGMVPFTPTGCDLWHFDPTMRYYYPANDTTRSVCLGGTAGGNSTSVLGPCHYGRAWRLYDDGLLTLANSDNLCLGPAGLVVRCDGNLLRVDKLWSFGLGLTTLASVSTRPGAQSFMLVGQSMVASGSTFQMNSNGDLLIIYGSAYNVVRSNAKPTSPPLMKLGADGSLRVMNLYGNVTYSQGS